MTAGRLDEKITIERETPGSDDGAGGKLASSWAAIAAPWAEARPVRGSERVESGQTANVKTWLFVVRNASDTSGVDHKDRIRWDGQIFNILSVRRGRPNGKDLRSMRTIEAASQVGVA